MFSKYELFKKKHFKIVCSQIQKKLLTNNSEPIHISRCRDSMGAILI